MNFLKFEKSAISEQEQRNLTGGSSVWDLVQAAWDATPDGGISHWENQNDGTFDGWIVGPGYVGTGTITY